MIVFKSLNKRALQIIITLLKNRALHLEDLAEEFKVSDRTIRYDIEKINTILYKEKLKGIQKEGSCFYITQEEIEPVSKILKKYGDLSSEDRMDYLILKLVSENSIKLAQEAKLLGVTRKTLAKDMIEVKSIMEREAISLIGLAGVGIKIEGKEYDIRMLFGKYLLKLFLRQNILNTTLKEMLKSFMLSADYPMIEDFVREILKRLKKRVPAYSFHAMCAVAVVSKLRKSFYDGSLDEVTIDQLERAETLVKMVMVDKTRYNIIETAGKKILDFTLNKSDINIIAKITMETDSQFNDYLPFFQEAVKQFLLNLGQKLNIEIISDDELKNNLCLKLSIGKLKVKYDIMERNFSSRELAGSYLKLFEIIKSITEDMFGFINEEDLISVTILMKEFIEKNCESPEKKRIIVIDDLHLDQWMGKVFVRKLSLIYEVEVKDIISSYELKDIKKGDADFAITLSPINTKNNNIPLIYINYLELHKNMDLLEDLGLRERIG